jgi:filamentous hemagglutinin family protein
VRNGGEAFFNNANDIVNIFSRVTGGNISNIDGLLRANGGANLFLINPAGIIFGEGARLDIGGSFYGTSADSILFEDGEFSATDLDNPPLLTINAPIGLSFRDDPGDITVRGNGQGTRTTNELIDTTDALRVDSNQTFALVGGNINLEGATIKTAGGRIELGSVEGNARVNLTSVAEGFSLGYEEVQNFQDIQLSQTSTVDASGLVSGDIRVRGNNITLTEGSIIEASTVGTSLSQDTPGTIEVDAVDPITIDGEDPSNSFSSGILSRVYFGAVGDSGDINITTANLTVTNDGFISTTAIGEGNSGNITVSAGSVDITDASTISSGTLGAGNPGNINIEVINGGAFNLSNSFILSSKEETGNAGNITVSAGSIDITDGSNISSRTFGAGNGGNIDIEVTNSGAFNLSNSQISTDTFGTGNAGNITISAGLIDITDFGFISSASIVTLGAGNPGNGGNIDIEVTNGGAFNLSDSVITTDTSTNGGNAGNITVNAGSIFISQGAAIFAGVGETLINTELFLFNAAGNLLAANDDSDNNDAGSDSNLDSLIEYTFSENGTYTIGVGSFDSFVEGGEIEGNSIATGENYTLQVSLANRQVNTGENGLVIKIEPNNSLNQAQNINNFFVTSENSDIQDSTSIPHVSISANGDGTFDYYSFNATAGSQGIFDIDSTSVDSTVVQAGNINLNATGDITITNDSSVSATTPGRGLGGSVNIDTPNLLTIRDGSSVEVSSEDLATSGDVLIKAGALTLEGGTISADTASGQGGLLDINVDNTLSLRNNSEVAATAGGNGDGGNINIDTNFIVAFPNQNNDIIANAQQGNGGNIDITAESIFGIEERTLNNFTNDINATSALGAQFDGTVEITIPDINAIQTETQVPNNLIESDKTPEQACQSNRINAAKNGLNILGKGGITPQPIEPLQADNIIIDSKFAANYIPPEIKPIETDNGDIYPARGIIKTADGGIILTAYPTENIPTRTPIIKPNCR